MLMTKYIDWIAGKDPKRYTISDDGRVYDNKRKRFLAISRYKNGPSLVSLFNKTYYLENIVCEAFPPKFYEFKKNDKNKHFKYIHRNGLLDDCGANNIVIGMTKSNISVEETMKIYSIILSGETDNTEISLIIGHYVPKQFVERLTKGKFADEIAAIFGIDYSYIPNKRTPRPTPHRKLTITEVSMICDALKKYGSPKKASEHIDFATYKQVSGISSGQSYSNETMRLLPENIKETSKDFTIGKPEDTENEIWKEIPRYILKDTDPVIYVSSKGNFINNIGDPIYVKISTGYARIDIGDKEYQAARIVLSVFDIDLPHVLGLPYQAFNVGFKDGNSLNICHENLRWVPYMNKTGGFVKNISLEQLNNIITKIKSDNSYKDPDKLRKYCMSIGIEYRTACYIANGTTFSYFTKSCDELTWKPIKGFDNYQVSTTGIIKRFNTVVRPFKIPYDERYFVKINGKYYPVCKIVLETFKGKHPTKKYPGHKDGDFNNDNVDNLTWYRTPENTTICQKRDKYHIIETFKLLDWFPSIPVNRYKVSNIGRVYDIKKDRFVTPTTSNGSQIVRLRTIENKITSISIAVLVIGTFSPDIRNRLQIINKNTSYYVKFIDNDKTNCVLNNLIIEDRCSLIPESIIIVKKGIDGIEIRRYPSMAKCIKDNPGVTNHGLYKYGGKSSDNYGEPYNGFIWEIIKSINK